MRSFNNSKYFLSSSAQKLKPFFLVERFWLTRYLTLDARFSKLSKQYTKNFLIRSYSSFFLMRGRLRSKCFFSRAGSSISKHLFWMGRHSANNHFKTGRITGFKKC